MGSDSAPYGLLFIHFFLLFRFVISRNQMLFNRSLSSSIPLLASQHEFLPSRSFLHFLLNNMDDCFFRLFFPFPLLFSLFLLIPAQKKEQVTFLKHINSGLPIEIVVFYFLFVRDF